MLTTARDKDLEGRPSLRAVALVRGAVIGTSVSERSTRRARVFQSSASSSAVQCGRPRVGAARFSVSLADLSCVETLPSARVTNCEK